MRDKLREQKRRLLSEQPDLSACTSALNSQSKPPKYLRFIDFRHSTLGSRVTKKKKKNLNSKPQHRFETLVVGLRDKYEIYVRNPEIQQPNPIPGSRPWWWGLRDKYESHSRNPEIQTPHRDLGSRRWWWG